MDAGGRFTHHCPRYFHRGNQEYGVRHRSWNVSGHLTVHCHSDPWLPVTREKEREHREKEREEEKKKRQKKQDELLNKIKKTIRRSEDMLIKMTTEQKLNG